MDFMLDDEQTKEDVFAEGESEVTESPREIIKRKLREHFDGKMAAVACRWSFSTRPS